MSEQNTDSPAAQQEQVEYMDIPGFVGYRSGTDGTIWSRRGLGRGEILIDTWHKMKPIVDRNGYLYVRMRPIGANKQHAYFVHVLVLITFVGAKPDGMQCRHFPSNDSSDNRLSNLQWGTPLENEQDKVACGTKALGSKNGLSKLTESEVLTILQEVSDGDTQTSVAKRHGIHQVGVSKIVLGKTWKHVPRN